MSPRRRVLPLAALGLVLGAGFVGGCGGAGAPGPAEPTGILDEVVPVDVSSAAAPVDVSGAATMDDAEQAFADQLFAGVNGVRATQGLGELAYSPCASGFAGSRGAALLGQAELVHASLVEVNQACGLAGQFSGENLVRGAATPDELLEAWLESPGHRANLLNPDFTDAAIACFVDADFAAVTGIEVDPAGPPPMLCAQIFLG